MTEFKNSNFRRKLTLFFTCLLLAGVGVAEGQSKSVHGTVLAAEDGEPIIGATVLIKGTTTGAVTNIDGEFTIPVGNASSVLVISYVGMKSQELPAVNGMVVKLISDASELNEVLVVAYGTSTKGTFTGSAGVVSASDIGKRQVSNVTNALSGVVAGVQTLSANGQPGASASIRIRGVGSINASSNPLYVVDGIPFDGDLSSINSNDIESITVLKDAASTALYGARGANGIVMITTKKAASGKSTISIDGKFGVNSRGVKNYDVLTSTKGYLENQYTAIYNAGLYNLGKTADEAYVYANNTMTKNSEGGSGYTIYTLPTGGLLMGKDGKLNPAAKLGYSDGKYYYTPDNWSDEIFQNNARQEYNLTFSGSQTGFNYYLSVGYLDDQGVINNSGFTRYSGRFKSDYQMRKWLKVGANVSYNNVNSRYPSEQTSTSSSGNAFYIANNIAPIYPLYVRDASSKNIMLNSGRKVYDYGDGVSTNYSRSFMSISNPAGDLTYDKRFYAMNIMNSSWFAEIKPIDRLVITARYGLNVDNTRLNEMSNAYMGQSAASGGTVMQGQYKTVGFNQQYVANYQLNINDDHDVDLTAGYDGYTYSDEKLTAYGTNMYNPEDPFVSNVIDNYSITGSRDNYATEGFFARVNYSYDDRYFGNIAYRRDASSRFSPKNRWGNFWSASGAWMISKESYFNDLKWVNLLKLKASFGEQGNDAIGNYYAYKDQYTVTGSGGIFADGVLTYKGNPDLTWETSVSYNLGADFALFSQKLNGSIEYFGRKSSDMLYYKPVAGSLGYSSIPMNVGSMTNSGVEIDLSYKLINTKNFKWNANVNGTFIKNKINELHPQLEGVLIDGTRIYEEGYSMYRMYLVEYAGVDKTNGLAQYWAEDVNGNRIKTSDYSVAQNYKKATDNLMPAVYGGFGSGFEAYGFDASVQLAYQLGGKIYDSGYQRLMHGGTSNYAGQNWHTDIKNAWTENNTNTDVPRLNANDKYANSTSTRFLTSSDYLSLNNITIGYTIPDKFLKKIDVSRVRVYVVGDNLYLLSARKGLDPRQSYTSATTSVYTSIRTISGGFNITF